MSEVKENTIGKEFTLIELIKFAIPPILTQFISSLLQTLDDGLFISRFVGKDALAAFNICMPYFLLINAFQSLFAGVSIYCSQLLGEKKGDKANSAFTTMLAICFFIGVGICCFSLLFLDNILDVLGITERTYPYAKAFMSVTRFNAPLSFVYIVCSNFFVPAGKPKLTMLTSMIQTFMNFALDYVFICVLKVGIAGAAYSNIISMIVVLSISLVFFTSKNAEIRITRADTDIKELIGKVWSFGRSQFFTMISISLNAYICNYMVMYIGNEECMSAYAIVNGIQFVFMSTFFGLSSATTPIASYAFGEKNCRKLSRILKQTALLVICLSGVIMLSYYFGYPLMMKVYLNGSEEQTYIELIKRGLLFSTIVYPFLGVNIISQDCFNAVSNHKAATILTILENVIFSNATCILMPLVLNMDGIWLSFATSEFLTIIVTSLFIYKNRNNYGYGKEMICNFSALDER